ncbi:helix-turn-helix domain-containing protein [Azospirillum aestuarii]|uniref:helix-turn-helix domain-containing protein n=1 Tax=Azospirillum aestuarii TaxID=2802052 RepID=UPI0040551415
MSAGVGERLVAIRKALGETQKAMGERMGVGTNTWPVLEREGRLPKAETLTKLAETGFSIDWLVTGEGTMMRAQASQHPVASPKDERPVALTVDAALWREMAIVTFEIFQEEDVDLYKIKAEKFAEVVDAVTELEAQERASPNWKPSPPSERVPAVKPSLLRRLARLILP